MADVIIGTESIKLFSMTHYFHTFEVFYSRWQVAVPFCFRGTFLLPGFLGKDFVNFLRIIFWGLKIILTKSLEVVLARKLCGVIR